MLLDEPDEDDLPVLGMHWVRWLGQSMAKCSGEQYHWSSQLKPTSQYWFTRSAA